jgi:hypothetical protein
VLVHITVIHACAIIWPVACDEVKVKGEEKKKGEVCACPLNTKQQKGKRATHTPTTGLPICLFIHLFIYSVVFFSEHPQLLVAPWYELSCVENNLLYYILAMYSFCIYIYIYIYFSLRVWWWSC